MKHLLTFLLIVFVFATLSAQETIVDTVYSISELDGCIATTSMHGTIVNTNSSTFYVGDEDAGLFDDEVFYVGYLSFELPELPADFYLESAYLYIYQSNSFGNSIYGDYPEYNIEGMPPQYFDCSIYHIEYGNSLDVADYPFQCLDWSQSISDSPTIGWREKVQTEMVLDDIENNRQFVQFCLDINSPNFDNDGLDDYLTFETAETTTDFRPHMVYVINSMPGNSQDDVIDSPNATNLSVFPNPFTGETTISFSLTTNLHENARIEIFNVKGQLVETLSNLQITNSANQEIIWDANNFANGIYFYKLVVGGIAIDTKKMMLIK
ncbi:MAG: T9SS type A sorting domain-containing protein [Candidatus Cloacimonetes bacterium]|jgi:hypothetical protein|nr:T9SS type A sorting domain-containing protein [Candidatus Cloacimonadota bacterium]MBT6994781.1 T9SS type A sorting domain-containing protein [Candidatus Cloacimonadota bacterium]